MSPFHSLFGVPAPVVVHWQGASGRWYEHSVFPLRVIPDWITACNYIFTAPRPDGKRNPLYIGETGEFDVRLGRHEKLPHALMLGGTEVHVHFGAFSRQHRLDIEADLRRGQPTPLNRQGSGGISASNGFGMLGAPNALGIVSNSNPLNALGIKR